jgi:hypothetical protein
MSGFVAEQMLPDEADGSLPRPFHMLAGAKDESRDAEVMASALRTDRPSV